MLETLGLEGSTALLLARAQFAFTVSFHFIFPSFSIGLASFLAVLNGLWLWTRDETYLNLFQYWSKIFAIAFAMGVVSGLVMSYQFGTNWSVFSDRLGPVLGPLMAYEVLTAFFLEAGFLGVMLFGRQRVGDGLHMVATAAVAIGTALSAFWILSVNSWMHTPAGFTLGDNGQVLPADWWAVVFNPSFPYRLVHTVLAAYLTTALAVGGVGAFQLLRARRLVPVTGGGAAPEGKPNPGSRRMFSMAMWMAALVAPLQIVAGDMHGLNTLEHQPAKVMAMEGHFRSHPDGAPLALFGWPDLERQELRWAVEIPYASSLILRHDPFAPLAGLDTIPREEWPPVPIVFWSFRIMVGIGFSIVGLGLWSLWARWRGRLYDQPWLHRAAVLMGPAGFVAVIAGWITTEVGRQPWVATGLLRTADAVSPIAAPAVAASLLAFVLVYTAVFGVGIWYILRLMSRPPALHETPLADGGDGAPIRSAGTTPAPSVNPGAIPAE